MSLRLSVGFMFYLGIVVCMVAPPMGWSDTITLTTGKKVVGKIVGLTEDRTGLIMDVDGKRVVYHQSEIHFIDAEQESEGINTVPMYGGRPKVPADQEFIETATKEAGSKEIASQQYVELGRNYLDTGHPKTAMKRFNQAWLLNPNNADVFLGFGSVALAQRDADGAIDMFNRAITLNPQYGKAMCLSCVAHLVKASKIGLASPTASPYIHKSAQLCEAGSVIEPQQELCYSTWATALFLQNQYAQAWDKVRKARALGGKTLSADFLKELSGAMPEPPN